MIIAFELFEGTTTVWILEMMLDQLNKLCMELVLLNVLYIESQFQLYWSSYFSDLHFRVKQYSICITVNLHFAYPTCDIKNATNLNTALKKMFTTSVVFPRNTSIRFFVRSYAKLAVNAKVNTTQNTDITPPSSTISSITPGKCNINFECTFFFN